MKSKFNKYEIVKVVGKRQGLKNVYGVEAPIVVMTECDGHWYYSLVLHDGFSCGVTENEIESTGKFASPDECRHFDEFLEREMKTKFEKYELVRVVNKSPRKKKIYGRTGYISGKYQNDDGTFAGAYNVSFSDGAWFLQEDEIESTGKFANPDDYKPVDTVRVRVLPDGSGEIVKDD